MSDPKVDSPRVTPLLNILAELKRAGLVSDGRKAGSP